MFTIFVFAFVVVSQISAASIPLESHLEEYCWSTDSVRSQRTQFSTRTAYQNVRPQLSQSTSVPNCTPQKIWMLNRHGTRLPEIDDIPKMSEIPTVLQDVIDNYNKGNQPSTGALCNSDFELLKTWKWNPNITIQIDEYLTDQGWNDLKGIAQAYKSAFPGLFPNTYSSDKYRFRHTDMQRTEASYKAFIEGLFGQDAWTKIPGPPVENPDFLLRPQDTCASWMAHDAIHDASGTEPDNFRDTKIYKQLVEDVSLRLGFKKALKGGQIRTLYKCCRYNNAWNVNDLSPWCAAFTPAHILVLSYADDLKHFYKTGPGSKINSNVACPLVADFISHIDGNDDRTVVMFSHSSSMGLFFNALGVGLGDGTLTSSNYNQYIDNRMFRTSSILPFAANFAVVKYDCPNEPEREKVLILHNEQPIQFDWCNKGLCSWSEVKRRFSYFTDNDCKSIYCPGG